MINAYRNVVNPFREGIHGTGAQARFTHAGIARALLNLGD